MSTIPGARAHAVERRRQTPFKSYDDIRLNRSCFKSIGVIKKERLFVKNVRREKAGLEPKATYAEI